MLPSLNALRAFDAAGRSLTFRAAAEELGVTQGAVAQQVRGLEAQLGVRLFDRTARGLRFTGAGRGYHAQVRAAFSLLVEATTALRPEPSRVTISVTPTLASKWLIPRLAELTEEHPEIDLRILATEGISSFHRDGIDLAIRLVQPPFGASLHAEPLLRQDVVAVCVPGLLQGRATPLSPDALRGLTLLHDTHDLWPAFWREVLGEDSGGRERGLRFNQTTLTLDAALAGQGVALASRFLVTPDLKAGRLVQPVSGCLRLPKGFHLLGRRDALHRPAISTVMGWLRDAARSA